MLHEGELGQLRSEVVARATELMQEGLYVEIPVVYYDAAIAKHPTYSSEPQHVHWTPSRYVAVVKVVRPGHRPKLYMLAPFSTPDEIHGLRRIGMQVGKFAVLVHHTGEVVFLVVAEHAEKNLRPIVAAA